MHMPHVFCTIARVDKLKNHKNLSKKIPEPNLNCSITYEMEFDSYITIVSQETVMDKGKDQK